MISIDKRKEIFTRYFVKFHSIRGISRDFDISRGTVSTIINACKLKIAELKLQDELVLSDFIDLIVIQPIHKPRIVNRYKVTEKHIDIIKQLIIENEKKRTRTVIPPKKVFDLYLDFKDEIHDRIEEPISFVTFYKLAREIKIELRIIKVPSFANEP